MSVANGGGQGGPVHDRPSLRYPHVITDLAEVHAAVEKLLGGDMERDVRISPQLLMQMIERHNESLQGDEEPPTLEEKFKEGFDEGR